MATMTFLVGRHGSGCNQAIAKRLCLWKSPETKRKKSNLAATKTLDLFLLVFFLNGLYHGKSPFHHVFGTFPKHLTKPIQETT